MLSGSVPCMVTLRILIFRWVLLLGITAPAMASAALTEAEAPLKKVRIQLKWFHQFQFASLYAARDQGYFKRAGLDVEL